MPDMLVLKRDRKTGGVRMLVEIDADPKPLWTPRRPAPIPNLPAESRRPTAEPEDVEWFVAAVMDRVADHDWGPYELEDIDWRRLGEDLEDFAWSTAA